MNTDRSRECTLADYASLSGILLWVLLMCFCIILLANGAKQRARIFAPTASSSPPTVESGRSEIDPALTPSQSLSEAPAPPATSDQTGGEAQKLALLGMEGSKSIQENPGRTARVREVSFRKSRANSYKRSGSERVGASKRVKTMLIAFWRRYL
jgi:hypothetical protein